MNPKYIKAQQLLLSLIDTIETNDKLPSERQLMELTGYSRPTIQKSLDELENEGIIYKIPRVGTFISDKKLNKKLAKLTGFTEEILASGGSPSTKVLLFDVITAGKDIGEKLAVPHDADVYKIIRLRYNHNVPLILEEAYFPLHILEGVTTEVLSRSLYAFIEQEKQLAISMSKQIIQSTLPDAFVSTHLGISQSTPITLIYETAYLADGTVFEYSKAYLNPEKYEFEITSYK